ncbi:MAG: rhodanese-like domain-containing protein [Anaerotignum sp.]|nr:rhodanese-like domain-containing protein [Anaerotignum sp.]
MKKGMILLVLIMALSGCGAAPQESSARYQQITAEEAKEMIDTLDDEIILDVREQDEYDAKHIPDAILLPVGMIDEDTAEGVIPEKDSVVLVYCRSGNRSKTASNKLAQLGYTQVYEFGGINDWPYETE